MGGEIQRLVDVEQGIRHLRFIMETGSGVIEELRGDVREVVRLPRVPRGLQHRRGSGCGSGNLRIRSALHKAAICAV